MNLHKISEINTSRHTSYKCIVTTVVVFIIRKIMFQTTNIEAFLCSFLLKNLQKHDVKMNNYNNIHTFEHFLKYTSTI